jgi:uncharacterized membrane protein YphA (DoxX/SURF4 family)
MQLAKATAIYAAPVPLRLILAVTFIWAGLGKVVHTVPVQGEQAALLANMGYRFDAAPPPADPADANPADTAPANADQTDAGPDATTDAQTPPLLALAQDADAAAEAAPPTPPAFTAADFPEPRQVRSLHMIAVLTYTAAHPSPAEDGSTPSPIWPEWAARDHWPITMAWVAAITELAAGILVGVGLLTRLAALSLAATMLTAAWLTELGPAIQAGNTLFGFLPGHDLWDVYAWRPLLWQLALASAAISLALAGPGSLAIDRAPHDDEDDDELEED